MLESSFVTHVKQERSLTHFDQGLFLLDLFLRLCSQPTVFGQCLLPFFLSHLWPAAYLQETPITPQTKKAPTCLLVLMLALHCIALICYNYNAGPDSLFVRATDLFTPSYQCFVLHVWTQHVLVFLVSLSWGWSTNLTSFYFVMSASILSPPLRQTRLQKIKTQKKLKYKKNKSRREEKGIKVKPLKPKSDVV